MKETRIEDFSTINPKDVLIHRINTSFGHGRGMQKTSITILNEFCYRVHYDWKFFHEENDILIVDSVFECFVQNASTARLFVFITDKTQEKSRSKKHKAIILVGQDLKKYYYLLEDLTHAKFYKQEN